jgi:nitroimidazol reductase NimA-like FMN-containing flavoprotein (pyridoxamine 5'-phosphate oxidase superfamily)
MGGGLQIIQQTPYSYAHLLFLRKCMRAFELEVFKLPEMKMDEIEKLIQEQIVCRIAFKGIDYPSISLFQYTRMNGSLFFHFTEYGKKLESVEKESLVCVEIEDFTGDLGMFRFVLLKGCLREVVDPKKKVKVIRKMATEGKKRLSTKFLAAHGFGKGSDWSSFNEKKSMIIVEFLTLEAMGLSSP